jgi:toxin CcdB
MAQFDVHQNRGQTKGLVPYVVVVQSRRFDLSRRRVVVPLLSEMRNPDPRLNPSFSIEGNAVALDPLHIVSVASDRLGPCVASLKSDGDRIIAALDLLITRAWD